MAGSLAAACTAKRKTQPLTPMATNPTRTRQALKCHRARWSSVFEWFVQGIGSPADPWLPFWLPFCMCSEEGLGLQGGKAPQHNADCCEDSAPVQSPNPRETSANYGSLDVLGSCCGAFKGMRVLSTAWSVCTALVCMSLPEAPVHSAAGQALQITQSINMNQIYGSAKDVSKSIFESTKCSDLLITWQPSRSCSSYYPSSRFDFSLLPFFVLPEAARRSRQGQHEGEDQRRLRLLLRLRE